MTDAVDLPKCPTCARPKGAACVKLAAIPGGRVGWVPTSPHEARERRFRG